MRSPAHLLLRSAVPAVLTAGLLLAGAGAASADTASAQPEAVTFGLLGPVGLVAVALGVVGMTFGVVRQRRKAPAARAAEVARVPEPPVSPVAPAVAAFADLEEAAVAEARIDGPAGARPSPVHRP